MYRSGLARTRRQARQLVVHGHFTVNGIKVNIPSYRVAAHDVIDVKAKSVETTPFIIARETHSERVVPAWLEALPERLRILVHQLPTRAADRHPGRRAPDRRALLEELTRFPPVASGPPAGSVRFFLRDLK